jgi:hypothetical protein
MKAGAKVCDSSGDPRLVATNRELARWLPEKVAELENFWNSWTSELKEPLWRPTARLSGAAR